MKKIIGKSLTLILCGLFLLQASCGKKEDHKAFITMFTGEVKILRGADAIPAEVKQNVLEGDRITTAAGSFAVIQLGENKVIRIQENSFVDMRIIKDPGNVELFVEKGTVLSKVMKLSWTAAYKVKSPTMVAAVRGTEFSVEHGAQGSVVAVREGSVKISDKNNNTLGMVLAGNTAVVTEKLELKPIEKTEELELQRIAVMPIIDNIDTITPDQVRTTVEPVLEKNVEISKNIKTVEETTPTPLDELREKYGRIDEVHLYSGKVIQGVILNRGAVYRMITPAGPVNIPAQDVRNTQLR